MTTIMLQYYADDLLLQQLGWFTPISNVILNPTFLIENASARPSHPQIAGPADGGAQSVLGVYA